jgi:transposase
MRPQSAELERALTGRVREHHRFLLGELLDELEFLDEKIARPEARIAQEVAALAPVAEVVERLDSIPGVDRQTAILIVAEIGVDMSQWPTDKHLTAWAGLAPGNNETGGKARLARTRQGNKYLRRGLVQAAHAAARKKDNYLRSLYYRLARRRGSGRVAMAVARTNLQLR